MNKVVIFHMKLAQHTKDVVQMLAVVLSASLLCPDKHIFKVLTGAIRGGPNSQAILRCSLRLLAVQQNNTSIDRIWNGSNLVDAGIKDGNGLPIVPLLYGHLACWKASDTVPITKSWKRIRCFWSWNCDNFGNVTP